MYMICDLWWEEEEGKRPPKVALEWALDWTSLKSFRLVLIVLPPRLVPVILPHEKRSYIWYWLVPTDGETS